MVALKVREDPRVAVAGPRISRLEMGAVLALEVIEDSRVALGSRVLKVRDGVRGRVRRWDNGFLAGRGG